MNTKEGHARALLEQIGCELQALAHEGRTPTPIELHRLGRDLVAAGRLIPIHRHRTPRAA